jgi:hypothetical protein
MRVIRALSILATMCLTQGTLACEINSTSHELPTELEIIASSNEPVLLNREDLSQVERLQAGHTASVEEPVLLNREDLSQVQAPAEEGLRPSTVASLALPRLQVVLDDEGILLIDVEYTGSNATHVSAASVDSDEWAIDGFEDR